MAKLIEGFDYTGTNPVQRGYTVKEFQSLMREAVKAGAKRRAEDGDTFVHGKDGRILYEIYTIVPP